MEERMVFALNAAVRYLPGGESRHRWPGERSHYAGEPAPEHADVARAARIDNVPRPPRFRRVGRSRKYRRGPLRVCEHADRNRRQQLEFASVGASASGLLPPADDAVLISDV